MNRLFGTRCYLCGAMDRVKDAGVGWRKAFRMALQGHGIQWLDPTRKPIKLGLEDDESRRRRRLWKAQGLFDLVAKEMKPIRCTDLRMVDLSDWMVINIDTDIHACGTYEETTLGNRQKKPMLFHIEQGKANAPDWLFGKVPHEYIFSTWESLLDYVYRVSLGYEDGLGRWYFFDWTGENPTPPERPPITELLKKAITSNLTKLGLSELQAAEIYEEIWKDAA